MKETFCHENLESGSLTLKVIKMNDVLLFFWPHGISVALRQRLKNDYWNGADGMASELAI